MKSIISSFAFQFNEKISNFFSKDNVVLKCSAAIVGFIKRERKLTASDMIKMLAISSFRSKPSTLLDMTKILRSINPNAKITTQSLQERINSKECVAFVKMIFQDVLHQRILDVVQLQIELLKSFNRVLVEDSSKWELSSILQEHFKGHGGNGSKSALKINIIYDLLSGRFVHLSEHSGAKSDQTLGQETLEHLQKNDLLIRDLGYLKITNLDKIQKIGAFYLSRICGSTTIRLEKNGEPVNFAKLFGKKSIDGKLDIYAYVGTDKHYTRLVAYRVPEEIGAERKRKLNQHCKLKGHKTMSENVSRKDFNIYITNVPAEIWPSEFIATIYRLRWQIELIFKSWKSQLKIDFMEGKDKFRILVLLYSKWIVILICTNFYELAMFYLKNSEKKEASYYKIINWFLFEDNFRKVILKGTTVKFMKDFIYDICNGWSKNKRNKRKSSMEMVENKTPSYLEGVYS